MSRSSPSSSETAVAVRGTADPSLLVQFEQRRSRLLQQMTDATRELARDCDARLDRVNRNNVLAFYTIGSRLVEALDSRNEGTYGSNAARLLADYVPAFNGDVNLLYNLRQFAVTFSEDVVRRYATVKTASGHYLSLQHWFELSKIASEPERMTMLEDAVARGLSSRDLAVRVRSGEVVTKRTRSGGRKTAVPDTPLVGLERLRAGTLRLTHLIDVCDEAVFDEILNADAAEVANPVLLERLELDRRQIRDLQTRLDLIVGKIESCLERVRSVLASAPSQDTAHD